MSEFGQFDRAMRDPKGVYGEPARVLKDEQLNQEQKVAVLRQWECDARLLAVADEENMVGGDPSMLGRVKMALLQLGVEEEVGGPTKS